MHEGPHSIRLEENPTLLNREWLSNEPVFTGPITVSALRTCRDTKVAGEARVSWDVLQLRDTTLCPIDTRPIVKELLTSEVQR